MKTRAVPLLCAVAVLLALVLGYAALQNRYTFTLSEGENGIKTEQIQPVFRTVEVRSDCDTDVVFTDVETGQRYTIGYITPGMSEKIQLEKNSWYRVEGRRQSDDRSGSCQGGLSRGADAPAYSPGQSLHKKQKTNPGAQNPAS